MLRRGLILEVRVPNASLGLPHPPKMSIQHATSLFKTTNFVGGFSHPFHSPFTATPWTKHPYRLYLFRLRTRVGSTLFIVLWGKGLFSLPSFSNDFRLSLNSFELGKKCIEWSIYLNSSTYLI